jgi:hypothetical protein
MPYSLPLAAITAGVYYHSEIAVDTLQTCDTIGSILHMTDTRRLSILCKADATSVVASRCANASSLWQTAAQGASYFYSYYYFTSVTADCNALLTL